MDDTGNIRYVGKTTRTLEIRLKDHVRAASSKNKIRRHVSRWIMTLASLPTIIAVEINPPDLDEAERAWIKECRDAGFDLCNLNDGGGGNAGYKITEEGRANIREAARRRDPEVVRRAKAAVSAKLKGRKFSEEQRANMSRGSMGKPGTFTGRKHSPETLTRMSEAQKKAYAEGRKKVVLLHHTEETKKRMSTVQKAVYASGLRKRNSTWKR